MRDFTVLGAGIDPVFSVLGRGLRVRKVKIGNRPGTNTGFRGKKKGEEGPSDRVQIGNRPCVLSEETVSLLILTVKLRW